MEDYSTGSLRVRCVAESDKATGWATVREAGSSDDASSLILRPATPAEDGGVVDAGEAAPMTPPLSGAPAQGRGVKRPFEVKQELYDEPWGKGKRGKGGGKNAPWHKGKGKGKW